jgi:hypothetical protein
MLNVVVPKVTPEFQRVYVFVSCTRWGWSWDSSVGMTTLRLGLAGFRILAGAAIFIFFKTPRPTLVSTKLVIQWSSGFKRSGRESKHSSPCSAKVKNEWSYAAFMACTETTWASPFTTRCCERASLRGTPSLVSVQAGASSAVCASLTVGRIVGTTTPALAHKTAYFGHTACLCVSWLLH